MKLVLIIATLMFSFPSFSAVPWCEGAWDFDRCYNEDLPSAEEYWSEFIIDTGLFELDDLPFMFGYDFCGEDTILEKYSKYFPTDNTVEVYFSCAEYFDELELDFENFESHWE